MDFKAQIEKLEGSKNWTKWKRQVGLLLRHHDVLDIVSGDRLKPSELDESASADQRTRFEVDQKAFMKSDAMAQLILVGSLDDANVELTATCDSAKTTWDKLVSIYEQSSGQRVDRLMELFFTCEKDASEDVVTHISRLQRNFRELNDELKRLVKTELPDLLLMSRIMSTLPPEYFEFKSVWESVPIEERTINKLTERLRLIEMRLPGKQSDSTAFVAKFSNKIKDKKPKPNTKKYPDIKCFKCHKTGHIAKQCFKKNIPKQTSDGEAFMCTVKGVSNEDLWLADSGASAHMTKRKDYFLTYEPFSIPKQVRIGNSETILAYGQGTLNVEMLINEKWIRNYLQDVWYVPNIDRNLFSVGKTLDKGFNFKANKNECLFIKNGVPKLRGTKISGGLYALEMRVRVPEIAAEVYIASQEESIQMWHERLCHQNKHHVKEVLDKHGISVVVKEELCDGCMFGKHHRRSFSSRPNRPTEVGALINADVCGPMEVQSIGGSKYFVLFKDDFSKFRRIFFLKFKSEVSKCLKIFLNEAKAAGHTVKEFLSDGGKEFLNSDVCEILQSQGINIRRSMPYTPQQNGAAERDIRTLVESARSLIHARNLPIKLWAEAVNTVAYILNQTGPTTMKDKTPSELWLNRKVLNIDNLRIFGTRCFVHVPKQKRHKWDKKSTKGFFVGYCGNHDGYRIWLPDIDQIILSRDVIFEKEMTIEKKVELSRRPVDTLEVTIGEAVTSEVDRSMEATDSKVNVPEEVENESGSEIESRSKRKIKMPEHLKDYVLLAECNIPDSYTSAMKSEYAREWENAMNEEMASLAENKVWHLVNLPPGEKCISNRWVLRVKTKADGSIDRYKARLVAKGYSQKQGIDYDETFSPVARFDTVRTVLSVAASENLHLLQFDIKTAFLYGELHEKIFMKQPEGYDDGSGRVCKLDRSLYGLKQAPRCWNKRFVKFIENQGLNCSKADPCLFFHKSDEKIIIIAIYVDDGLIAGSNSNEISKFVDKLRAEFKITVGSLDCFLGMQIRKLNDGSVFLNQCSYIKKILDKFGMSEANAVATPSEKKEENDLTLDHKVPYREAVGSLMYLSTATRPDIAYAVSIVSENLESPLLCHWQAVKRIFKYLKGTTEHGLLYKAHFEMGTLKVFSDADYAGDTITRRSRTGILSMYSGGAITWTSQKQKSVVLSTTEAEYIAASEATKEIIWLARLLCEISTLSSVPTLYVDNASAIKLVKNPEFHKRSKHIEVKYHFIREKYNEKIMYVEHIEGTKQIADIMTKPLPRVPFEKLRFELGQYELKH